MWGPHSWEGMGPRALAAGPRGRQGAIRVGCRVLARGPKKARGQQDWAGETWGLGQAPRGICGHSRVSKGPGPTLVQRTGPAQDESLRGTMGGQPRPGPTQGAVRDRAGLQRSGPRREKAM